MNQIAHIDETHPPRHLQAEPLIGPIALRQAQALRHAVFSEAFDAHCLHIGVPHNVIAQMPPLLKAYMRLGAKICGEPCWDETFQVADVFILLKRDELCPRYARHFKAAV